MNQVSLENFGRTVVLSDLHLNTLSGRFEQLQEQCIDTIFRLEKPETVLLNGDTFDLFFDFGVGRSAGLMASIVERNSRIIKLISQAERVIVLAGAHDQGLLWDEVLRGEMASLLPSWGTACASLIDDSKGVVVVPGNQWYYDNIAICDGRPISLTRELTNAFKEFLLSGRLSEGQMRDLYMDGVMSFWYKTGSHYEFMTGMERSFNCKVAGYFDALAKIFRRDEFSAWGRSQYYDEFKSVAQLTSYQAACGGEVFQSLAPTYWKMLGATVKRRLESYCRSGELTYPPDSSVGFKTAIVGHTHIGREQAMGGRRIVFVGSTKPQTRMLEGGAVAQNELRASYALIDKNGACILKQLEPIIERNNLGSRVMAS